MDKQAVRNKLLGQKLSEYFAKNPDKKSVVMQADIGEGKVYWRAIREDANVFKVTEVTTKEEKFSVTTESKKKALSEAKPPKASLSKSGAKKTISAKSQATSKSAKQPKKKAESQPKTKASTSKPDKTAPYDRFMGSTRSGKPIKSAMHPAYKDVHFAQPGSTSRDSALKINFNSYSPEDHADASTAHERNSMLAHIAGDSLESSLHANAALAHDQASGGTAPSRNRKTKDLENTARGMGWDLQPTQWADPAMVTMGPQNESTKMLVHPDAKPGETLSGKKITLSTGTKKYKDVVNHDYDPKKMQANADAVKKSHPDFDSEDHHDAARMHDKLVNVSLKMAKHPKANPGAGAAAKRHGQLALAHHMAAGGSDNRQRPFDAADYEYPNKAEGKIGNPLDYDERVRMWKKKKIKKEGKIGNPLKDEERWRRKLISQKFIKETVQGKTKKEAFLEAMNSLSDADKLNVLVNEIGMDPKKAKKSLKNLEIVAQTLYPVPNDTPQDWPYDENTMGAINSPSTYSPRMTS